MQIEYYLYQKDLFLLPLERIAKKLVSMTVEAWEMLDRKALGTIRLCLAASVAFNVIDQKTTKNLMKALNTLYEKPLASNKVFLMKYLLNLKMSEGDCVTSHLNKLNSITSSKICISKFH